MGGAIRNREITWNVFEYLEKNKDDNDKEQTLNWLLSRYFKNEMNNVLNKQLKQCNLLLIANEE